MVKASCPKLPCLHRGFGLKSSTVCLNMPFQIWRDSLQFRLKAASWLPRGWKAPITPSPYKRSGTSEGVRREEGRVILVFPEMALWQQPISCGPQIFEATQTVGVRIQSASAAWEGSEKEMPSSQSAQVA